VQQQTACASAASDRTKSPRPRFLASKHQLAAVLDRQHIAPRNQARGSRRSRLGHLGDRHSPVIQKARELYLARAIALGQTAYARPRPRHQRSLQNGPPFSRRRSPNRPSPAVSQTNVIEALPRIILPHGISLQRSPQSRCVHMTAEHPGGCASSVPRRKRNTR
jgi:hypothetical protein